MKTRRFAKQIVILVAIAFVMTSLVLAQDKPKKTAEKDANKWESTAIQKEREKYTEDKRPIENYLEKFTAQEIIRRLIRENLEKIYMLKVVVSNFPQNDWPKVYQDIYNTYKKAMGLYYKRDVIYTRVELEKNKNDINNLYKKIADKYRDDAEKMLDVCAESILILSLNPRAKSDPGAMKQYYTNLSRMKIAYEQMDEAMSSYRDNLFQRSVFHFRNAKTYAIHILEDLLRKEEIEKRRDLYEKEEYDSFMKLVNEKDTFRIPIHKADNLNRIMEKRSTTAKTSK
jgi:hypothetical protein